MFTRTRPILSPTSSTLGWHEYLNLDERLEKLVQRNPTRGVVLDLSRVERVYIQGIVPLVATVERLRQMHDSPITVVAPEDSNTRDYCERQQWLNGLSPVQYPVRQTTSKFSIKRFENGEQLNDAINELQRATLERLRFAKGANTAFDWSINEVADNVLNHSGSIGYLQVMPHGPKSRLSVVVCDNGLGIPATIRQSFAHIRSDREALAHAIQKGVTRDTTVGQGNGLGSRGRRNTCLERS